jgi:hypothetical protein
VWKRERMGRTSVETVREDPVALGEAVADEDSTTLNKVAVEEAQRSGCARRRPSGGRGGGWQGSSDGPDGGL